MAVVTITVTVDILGVAHVGFPTHANNGDTIQWDNQSGDEVIVFWPHDGVFGQGSAHFHHQVPKQHKHSPGKVSGAAKNSRFRYAVYCSANQNFAIGNSNPEIIIDT